MSKILNANLIKVNDPQSIRIQPGLLKPAKEVVELELVSEHAAEPIKNPDDIKRMSEYFISNGKYRDNMLFICGINFGLRVSDLLELRFSTLINPDMTFKNTIPIFEIKTRNTRKKRRNRHITINRAVQEAVVLYLSKTDNVSLSDFLFRSESNRGKSNNCHIHRNSMNYILKSAGDQCGLTMRLASHSLRKTFAYHQMLKSHNDPRKLLLLQKIFGHASMAQTLDYIGITGEEMENAYSNFNLGSVYDTGELVEEELSYHMG